jgi:hypothetical protein
VAGRFEVDMHQARWNLIGSVAWLITLLALAGCGGPKGPATVPVTGKLTFTRGGPAKVLADRQGIIQFESLDQPGVFAYGDIQEDGRFELATVVNNVKKSGAVKGEHRFRLRLDDNAHPFVAPEFLDWHPTKIVVTQPNQHVEVKVWR